MKWSENIVLNEPLRDVRHLTDAPLEDWQDHARQREQTAYDRGRLDGERALGEQLLQQRSELVELQNGILNSLRRAVADVVRDTESALIQLALQSAQKIVAGLPISAELVEAVIREALRQVEDTAEVTIHLNSEDLILLRKHNSPILAGDPNAGPVRFVTSSEVTRGGCLAQTRFGLIDARRETKLEQLKQTLSQ